jgi:hypothetical protein
METDDKNDDDHDGADDARGMLKLDRSLSGKNEFYCVGEMSAEKSFWNSDRQTDTVIS